MSGLELSFYTNPLLDLGFADPYVLKYCGQYWAYCTGFWNDGRCFGILHSPDLINWNDMGGAMQPLPAGHSHYWAPEVAYSNGIFYLYYSAGNEENMHLRVATSVHPAGPFQDSGRQLTRQKFAIDAHRFVDEDGQAYIFYATDFLEHSHVGTGTVIDEMLDPLTLAGNPRPVTLARYDWQVYDPHRASKGGVRWHTVEGPFVLKHKDRYYQMFSGGNWQNPSYGVSYATSDSLSNPDQWRQVADGERVLPILRTKPGLVIGPGHNSVVRGPNNRQLFCVYHRWSRDNSLRQMALDLLDWAGERMLLLGPSSEPQPVPLPPYVAGFQIDGSKDAKQAWLLTGGSWNLQTEELIQREQATGTAAELKIEVPYCLLEVSLRSLEDEEQPGSFGLNLSGAAGCELQVEIVPAANTLNIFIGSETEAVKWPLPAGFKPGAFHLVRLELDSVRVKLWLDDIIWPLNQLQLKFEPECIRFLTFNHRAAFCGFEMTYGWEDLFMVGGNPWERGWHSLNQPEGWHLRDQQLWCTAGQQAAIASKGPQFEAYELVVNARLEILLEDGGFGFYPAYQKEPGIAGPLVKLEQVKAEWKLSCETDNGAYQLVLPAGFDPYVYQQFRFHRYPEKLLIAWENFELGEIKLKPGRSSIALYACQATVAFDMVRVTLLPVI